MSPVASILMVALVSQSLPRDLEEQREFEAALLDRDRFSYVLLYVSQNQYVSHDFMELVAKAAHSEIDEVSRHAIHILEKLGPQAAEFDELVLPFLAHEDPSFRIAAIECLGSIRPGRFYPEIARLAVFDEDDGLGYAKFDSVYHAAIRVLVKSESLEAAPYILAIYLDADPWRSSEAIRQTSNCPPALQQALIPSLVQLLGHQEMGSDFLSSDMHFAKPIREIAIETLGEMGELPLPHLAEIERWQALEEDPEIQISYAATILKIKGNDDKQVEILRTALSDSKQPRLQTLAGRACADLPWVAEMLAEKLLVVMESEEQWVREAATEAICATDLNTPEVIAALNLRAVDYGYESWSCWTAMKALAVRGELHEPMEFVLQAMEASGNDEGDAYEASTVLQLALDDAAILEQIEAAFAEADVDRQSALIYLLDWISADAAMLERLLELPLLDEQRWMLERYHENAQLSDPYRVTDWRRPEATEEPAPCGG